VNNAGIVAFESLLDGSLDTMRQQFETNVFGMLEMTRAFAPTLKSQQGAVVNVLSAAAWFSAQASLNGLEHREIEVLVDSDSHTAEEALTGPPNAFAERAF